MFEVYFINLGEAWGKHVRETCNELIAMVVMMSGATSAVKSL